MSGAVAAVIPLGDENPTRRRPWFTWLLVAANFGVFLFVQPWYAGTCERVEFFVEWAAVPAELTQAEPLDEDQMSGTPADECGVPPQSDKPVFAAAFFSLFFHGNWLHLLGNMLYLGIFGNNVEDRLGHLRFLVFYLVSGAIATIVFVVPNADSPTTLVGASGAIAGVLGAYLVMYPRARVTVSVPLLLFFVIQLPAVVVLGLWFVLQLQGLRGGGMVAGGGVAYLAHAAGFVGGLVIALGLGFRPQVPRDRRLRQRRRYRR